MPKLGIALWINADFRSKNCCALCTEPLGDKPFIVLVELSPNAGATSYEHQDCRQFLAGLDDAT